MSENENAELKIEILNLRSQIERLENENKEYERAKEIIDWVTGFFQFKSKNSEIAQKGIQLLMELKNIVKKNMKGAK